MLPLCSSLAGPGPESEALADELCAIPAMDSLVELPPQSREPQLRSPQSKTPGDSCYLLDEACLSPHLRWFCSCVRSSQIHPRKRFEAGQRRFMVGEFALVFDLQAEHIEKGVEEGFEILLARLIRCLRGA